MVRNGETPLRSHPPAGRDRAEGEEMSRPPITPAEREARKALKEVDAAQLLSEHQSAREGVL
jgi:hypothetical protein